MTTAGRSPGRGARSASTARSTIRRSWSRKRSEPNWRARRQAGRRIDRQRIEGLDRLGQRLRVVALVVGARHALAHALAHAARAERDHGPPGGERLDGRDPELLRPR